MAKVFTKNAPNVIECGSEEVNAIYEMKQKPPRIDESCQATYKLM
jgi:hypothetical protein